MEGVEQKFFNGSSKFDSFIPAINYNGTLYIETLESIPSLINHT